MSAKKIQYRFYSVTFPGDFTIEQVLDFFDSVSASLAKGSALRPSEYIVVELWSDKDGIKHRLGIPWQRLELINQLLVHIPGINIQEDQRERIPAWTYAVEVGVSDNTRPFNLERAEAQVRRLLGSAIAEKKPDDTLLIQWVLAPADPIKPPAAGSSSSSWGPRVLLGGMQASKDEIAERRANAAHNQFRAVLRVAAASSTEAHAKKLVANVRNMYQAASTSSVKFTEQWALRRFASNKLIERINRAAPPGIPYNFINTLEVAAFSTWANSGVVVPGMTKGKTRHLPPTEIVENNGRALGLASASGYEKRRIAVSSEGATRHTYVIAPSGFGKTTLLRNMVQQDIERGHGVIIFDGKGDLINGGLDAVPKERIKDVVYLNFADSEYPLGFNILQEGDPRSVVDDLMSLFLHNAGGDVYLREMLYHGLHTMREIPGLTVVDLLTFLMPLTPSEEAWRDYVIDQLPKKGQLYGYWKAFYAMKPTERLQKVRPVQNRLWQITNRADLRNMLGQTESTISIRDILRDNKVLLVSIPQNLGKETVSLLGAIMFDSIWQQVQSLNMETPTHLYIDEVQRFLDLPIDLNDMLSTARSKRLGITMAHQFTSQLPNDLFAAVTNASTKIAFKLEGPDAQKMANLFGSAVSAEDFINLDKYEALARVAVPGGSSDPLTIKTFEEFPGHGYADRIIEESRKTYGRKAADVEAEIQRRRVAPSKPKAARPLIGDRPKGDRGDEMSGADE